MLTRYPPHSTRAGQRCGRDGWPEWSFRHLRHVSAITIRPLALVVQYTPMRPLIEMKGFSCTSANDQPLPRRCSARTGVGRPRTGAAAGRGGGGLVCAHVSHAQRGQLSTMWPLAAKPLDSNEATLSNSLRTTWCLRRASPAPGRAAAMATRTKGLKAASTGAKPRSKPLAEQLAELFDPTPKGACGACSHCANLRRIRS